MPIKIIRTLNSVQTWALLKSIRTCPISYGARLQRFFKRILTTPYLGSRSKATLGYHIKLRWEEVRLRSGERTPSGCKCGQDDDRKNTSQLLSSGYET